MACEIMPARGIARMSIRRRKWKAASGEIRESWVVDYFDGAGKRRLKTFAKKKDADAFASTSKVEIRQGVHVADSASVTVAEAGRLWLAHSTANGLETSTTDQYRQHLDLHIAPFLGTKKLSELTVPAVRAFEDQLRAGGRSPAMIRKVLVSLGSLLADAQENGLVARNVVRELRVRRKGKDERQAGRHAGKIMAGVDMPTPAEAKAIVGALSGRWRPIILTVIFTGLRASELRGLRWADLDLEAQTLTVRQRADFRRAIGSPKSRAGHRTVPIPPIVCKALREWQLACPKGKPGLVFPNAKGGVESHAAIARQGWAAAQVVAGVAVDSGKVDKHGRRIMAAKYPGLHAARHFYASWCINRKADGGLGLPAKMVQERLGHSSIVLTIDTYSHLFPRDDDAAEMAAAEAALLG
jgi:integrase